MTAPKFFATPEEFREWMEVHYQISKEVFVGFYKKGSGKPTLTWSESVDVALCYGWIDGIRKSVDEESYTIRFTPRKPGSKWSAINVKKIEQLKKLGLMRPEGLKRFEERRDKAGYSYEERVGMALTKDLEKQFRAEKVAWTFFREQAPSYRKNCIYWIMSAKQENTRARRLERLIQASSLKKRIY
jgi:uncharacterized protein YdeI (YjbR/CyaY-like superfamily)